MKHLVDPPWFEDFQVGDDLSYVPSVTITEGYAAVHQAVFGDRSVLPLSLPLSESVTGKKRQLANPSLVCNIAIGQSTIPTQRVMGNLFYRGLRFQQPVFVGDTLTTNTKIVALKQNSPKPGRPASGVAGLEIHVTNQHDETVLLFWRCPMVPCRDKDAVTHHADDLSIMPEEIPLQDVLSGVPKWDLSKLPATGELYAGLSFEVEARDTVTSAPEIVRMTQNLAMTHTDAGRSVYNKRLVYGGHTISLAAAQLSRVMPGLATILCWYSCDHVGPVFEGDVLSSVVMIGEIHAASNGRVVVLRIDVFAERGDQAPEPADKVKVLEWHLAVLVGEH